VVDHYRISVPKADNVQHSVSDPSTHIKTKTTEKQIELPIQVTNVKKKNCINVRGEYGSTIDETSAALIPQPQQRAKKTGRVQANHQIDFGISI